MDTHAAAMFGMICTIANGLVRSGPRSRSAWKQSSNAYSPPMPVATAAPTRSGSDSIEIPLSASAIFAAVSASCEKRSMRRARLRSIQPIGSKSFSSHAKCTS